MVWEIVKACGGLLACMAVWLAVQAAIRRRMGMAPDADVLEDMTHGCGACGHSHGGGCGGGSCATQELTVIGRQS